MIESKILPIFLISDEILNIFLKNTEYQKNICPNRASDEIINKYYYFNKLKIEIFLIIYHV